MTQSEGDFAVLALEGTRGYQLVNCCLMGCHERLNVVVVQHFGTLQISKLAFKIPHRLLTFVFGSASHKRNTILRIKYSGIAPEIALIKYSTNCTIAKTTQ
eukprot:Selendium_serpulae@DN5358_c0_g1_i6.p1